MPKYLRLFRKCAAIIFGLLFALAFAGMFYPWKIYDYQLAPLLQRNLVDFSLAALVLLGFLAVVTLLFGRIYCSTLCPLGLMQEALMFFFRRRVPYQKNWPYKYFLSVVMLGTLIGGSAWLMRLTDPYTLAGAAVTGSVFALAAVFLIAVLVWYRGRFFCSNICPVGTLLGCVAKHAVNKIYIKADQCISCGLCARNCPTGSIDFKSHTVNNETCIKCFKCLGACRKNGLRYGKMPSPKVPFNPRRRQFLVNGALVAAFAVALKSGLELSKAVIEKVRKVILPPGASNPGDFANRCLNCNLCVQSCPMKILKKADDTYPAVHIEYQDRFCLYDCHRCSEVCPSGAIKKLSLAEKQKLQIGMAVVDEKNCIRCGLCVIKCPRQIIHKEDGGFPQINADECIGCGACQSVCPVKAITISALEKQKFL